jgi:PREDICTED: similar to GA11371-PA
MLFMVVKVRWFKKAKTLDNPCDKVVLITGCDSGVGLEMAKYLYQLGFIVFASFFMPNSYGYCKLNSLIQNAEQARLHLLLLDVTNQAIIDNSRKIIEAYLKKYNIQGLWALINNAGTCVFGEFDWYTWDQIEKQIEVNLIGLIKVTQSFIPLIIEAKGRVINISSVNGIHSYPGVSIYSATKFGVHGFTDAIRLELYKFGVRVINFTLGDFAKLTNILKNQKQHMDQMWNAMSEHKKDFYREYFNDYNKVVEKNYGYTSPKCFEDTSFFTDLQEAVTFESPRDFILVANFSTRVFFFIYSHLNYHYRRKLLSLINKNLFKLNEESYFK